MRKPHVPPRESARDFQCHETFFSCTDKRGIILGGNAVFRRVSGYAEDELVGQPHNLIRHPDMPRTVFWLLWDYLNQGRPIAALVKNMAKDGQYYWVLAMAMPVADGHVSVRIKPTTQLVPVVEGLYQAMRAREIEGEQRGEDDAATYRATAALMGDALRKLGYESYDDFMQLALLQNELAGRDAALEKDKRTLFAPPAPAREGEDALAAELRAIAGEGIRQAGEFAALYRRIDELAQLHTRLKECARGLSTLTKDFNIISFNIALRASKLGHEGRGIAVIASRLTELSEETTRQVLGLEEKIHTVSDRLGQSVFTLAWARLQFEMVAIYYQEMLDELLGGEIAAGDPRMVRRLQMLDRLRQGFAGTGERTVHALGQLAGILRQLDAHTEELTRIGTSLMVAKVGGLIETSHLQADESFVDIFTDVTTQTRRTEEGFKELAVQVEGLLRHADDAPVLAAAVRGFVTQLQRQGERLDRAQAVAAKTAQAEMPALPAAAGVQAA